MKNKWVLLFILPVFLLGMVGCKDKMKEVKICGQIVNEKGIGIAGLRVTLKIEEDGDTGKSIAIKPDPTTNTLEEGKFEMKVIIPKEVLKNPDRYKGKIILDEDFCDPYEEPINFKELPIKIIIKTSYGAVIKGKIIDINTKSPIMNVEVSLIDVGTRTSLTSFRFSDKDGGFCFKAIEPKKVRIKCKHYLYKREYSGDLDLKPGNKEENITIEMEMLDPPLFKISSGYIDNIDLLKEEFKRKNYPLSDDVEMISIEKEGSKTIYWRLLDIENGKTYDMRKIEEELWVYKGPNLPPIKTCIPDPNNIFTNALNNGQFPEGLREEIKKLGDSLPAEAGIRVVGENRWLITGEEGIYFVLIKMEKEECIAVREWEVGPLGPSY